MNRRMMKIELFLTLRKKVGVLREKERKMYTYLVSLLNGERREEW